MRILIISKLFPPQEAARALQIGKVAQAICDAGCEVAVIAGKRASKSLCSDNYSPVGSYEVQYVPYHEDTRKIPWILLPIKICRRLKKEWDKFLWIRKARVTARKAISECKPHVIFTSSSPVDSHRVGLYLKRKTGIPWIVSFSDPWPFCLRLPPYDASETPISKTWDMWLLRQFLSKADEVHMPNNYAIQIIEEKTNIRVSDKAWSIPHIGSKINKTRVHNKERCLVHIGELGWERLCRPLLEAIKQVASINKTFCGLWCVGTICIEFENMIKQMGLEKLVKITGQVPPEKAGEIMATATALLVVEADMPMSPFLPSKFADYACAKSPIIAITPPVSAIRDYLGKYGGGRAVSHDTKEIVAAIRDVLSEEQVSDQDAALRQCEELSSVFNPERVGEAYIRMVRSVIRKEHMSM